MPALKPGIVGRHPRQVRRPHPVPHQPLHRLRQVINCSVSDKVISFWPLHACSVSIQQLIIGCRVQ
jgi:hypothetical protein